jgi:hypothetical protein
LPGFPTDELMEGVIRGLHVMTPAVTAPSA